MGHSALNLEGDAKREDVHETSVKAFLVKILKIWLTPSIGLLANVSEFEKSAFGAGTISLAQEPDVVSLDVFRLFPILQGKFALLSHSLR